MAERIQQGLPAAPDLAVGRARLAHVPVGESSVAAAIHDRAGHAVGAIGVVGDTERILPCGPAQRWTGA